jgi:hypothetical protein
MKEQHKQAERVVEATPVPSPDEEGEETRQLRALTVQEIEQILKDEAKK